jgi:arabinofuranan 3-O-arabinosyltransferase
MVTFAGQGKTWADKVLVDTSSGHLVEGVVPDGNPQPLALPNGPASFIKITFLHTSDGSPGYPLGIRTLAIPGVLASQTLQVPGSFDPDQIDFAVEDGARSSCLTVDGAAACDPGWAAQGEEDNSLNRTFTLSDYGLYRAALGVAMQPGAALDNLLDGKNPVRAIASSVQSSDPRERPGAAVDGNPATGWVAAAKDRRPALTISTKRPTRLTGIEIDPIANGPFTSPTKVLITAGKVFFASMVPTDGVIRFARAVTTDTVNIEVLASTLRTSVSTVTGQKSLLPVAIGEVDLIGPHAPAGTAPATIRLACGHGPPLAIDGSLVPTRLTALSSQVLHQDVVTARTCATSPVNDGDVLALKAGTQRVALGSDALSRPQSLVLANTAATAPATELSPPQFHELNWGSTARTVAVSTTSPALFVVHENVNAGWHATLDGARLVPLTVDGWQQAWLLPAGSHGVVHLVFTPQRIVSVGLAAGAVTAVALVPLALVPPRKRRKRRTLDRLGDAQPRTALAWVLVVGVLLLLGSVPGLVIGVVALGLSRLPILRRGVDRAPYVIGALLGVVTLAQAIAPASSAHPLAGSPGIQVLCLAVVAGLLLCCLIPRGSAPGGGEAP